MERKLRLPLRDLPVSSVGVCRLCAQASLAHAKCPLCHGPLLCLHESVMLALVLLLACLLFWNLMGQSLSHPAVGCTSQVSPQFFFSFFLHKHSSLCLPSSIPGLARRILAGALWLGKISVVKEDKAKPSHLWGTALN